MDKEMKPKVERNVRVNFDDAKFSAFKPPTTNAADGGKMLFDDLLASAGELGPYQLLIWLSTMPFYLFGAFVYFSQLFMTQVPRHWCWVPELAKASVDERRAVAIPRDGGGYAQCTQYANWTAGGAVTTCQHGWEFADDIPYPTAGSELGWVCERSTHQATAQAVFFAGSVCGLIASGWLADRAGRLRALVLCNLLGCVGGIASAFATDLPTFAATRFFVGMSSDNCVMLSYLLLLEYVAPKYRTLISATSFAVFYTAAIVALPWVALACGHWRTLGLVTSAPMAVAVLALFILPESPRWLVSQGRVDEVVKNVETVGRINKKQIHPQSIQQFRDAAALKQEDENSSVLDLLRRPLLRKVFILICLDNVCCDMIFDASVRSLSSLDYDFFTSFSLVSFAEFPACIAAASAMDWMGRRWLTTITMLLSGLFLILTGFLGGGLPSVLCAMIARVFISMCYLVVYQWAAELLPTPVRASGVSVIHIFGYVATVLVQYVVYLGTYIVWLPFVTSAALAMLGAIVALLLPETMKKEMPQTFDEAEALVRTQNWFDMPCWPWKEVLVIGGLRGKRKLFG